MATVRWVGGTTAVAQVDTLTVGGTIEADDVFTITVTGENGDTHAVTVTGGSTDADTVATAMAAAWNADAHYLCAPVTAAASGGGTGALTLTADTAGVPFHVSVATTEAGGGAADAQTFTRAATTANAGPYDWNTAANWDTGAVPVGGDTVYVEGGTVLYGMDQTGLASNLLELHVTRSQIGLNPSEGRNAPYLRIKATETYINEYIGPGSVTQSGPVMVDVAATGNITVFGGSANATTRLPSVWLKADGGAGTIDVRGGYVGIAYDVGSATHIQNLRIRGGNVYTGDGFKVSQTNGSIEITGGTADIGLDALSTCPTLDILGGTLSVRHTTATITAVRMVSGAAHLRCNGDTGSSIIQYGGTLTWTMAGGVGSYQDVTIRGGTFYWAGTANIGGDLTIYSGGTVDCTTTQESQSTRQVIGNTYLVPGLPGTAPATIIADTSRVTLNLAHASAPNTRVKHMVTGA